MLHHIILITLLCIVSPCFTMEMDSQYFENRDMEKIILEGDEGDPQIVVFLHPLDDQQDSSIIPMEEDALDARTEKKRKIEQIQQLGKKNKTNIEEYKNHILQYLTNPESFEHRGIPNLILDDRTPTLDHYKNENGQ